MKQYFIAWLLLLGLNTVAQAQSYFISDNKKINIKKFDKKILKVMDDTGIPGLSLAIIENNQIVYTHAYGYKRMTDKSKVDPNTLFEGCSLSKTFLVFVAYKLAEQGLLELDKPMYEYLPNKRLEYDPRYRLITPRMILSHTSGLENWAWYNSRDTLEILKDPGTEYTYSGEGFHYLAKVIAGILKEPYKVYVKRLILDPLQLTTTLNYTQADSVGDYATGHSIVNVINPKWITPEPWPASSVNTNAQEYAKLLIAMFNGTNFKPATIHTMLDTAKLVRKDSIGKYYVSNGFFVIINNNDTIVNFSGNNTGFKADMLYSITTKRGYVYLTNSDLGIFPSRTINNLTARLNADVYLNSTYAKRLSNMADLLEIYWHKGFETMIQEVDKKLQSNPDKAALEEVMLQLYWKNKTESEEMAKIILKLDSASSYANGVLGVINAEVHKNYDLARQYLTKAKKLKFNRLDLDAYLKMCDDKISKK
jgi:CubicO group peptidase (beta-lactamase class C family)